MTNVINFNARNTDPGTSHRASRWDRFKQSDLVAVWNMFLRVHPQMLSDFQLDVLMGGAEDGKWRKRRSDLYRMKWLAKLLDEYGEPVERFCPKSRQWQCVWYINDEV